eukprot:g4338.t1
MSADDMVSQQVRKEAISAMKELKHARDPSFQSSREEVGGEKYKTADVDESMRKLKDGLITAGSLKAMPRSEVDSADRTNNEKEEEEGEEETQTKRRPKGRSSFNVMKTLSLERPKEHEEQSHHHHHHRRHSDRGRRQKGTRARSATILVNAATLLAAKKKFRKKLSKKKLSKRKLRKKISRSGEDKDDGGDNAANEIDDIGEPSSSEYSDFEEDGSDGDGVVDWFEESDERGEHTESAHEDKSSINGRKKSKRNSYFDQFPSEIREAVLGAVDHASFEDGDAIVEQGEDGETMYVILEGEAAISVLDEETGKEKPITHIYKGDYFGETSLIYGVKRTATVRSIGKTRCCVLSRATYLSMPHFRSYVLLTKCDVTKDLDKKSKLALCKRLRPVEFKRGEFVIHEGHRVQPTDDALFMITKGEVEVLDKTNGHLVNLHVGHTFGEIALIRDAPRNASVRVVSKLVTCMALRKHDYNDIALADSQDLAEKLVHSTEHIEHVREMRRRVSQMDLSEGEEGGDATSTSIHNLRDHITHANLPLDIDTDGGPVTTTTAVTTTTTESPHLFRKRSETFILKMKPRSPTRTRREVNEYKLLQTLGRGSFAEVKLAEHNVSGEKFAMKCINYKKLQKSKVSKFADDMYASLLLEVKIMKLLHHKHIVGLDDVIDDRKNKCMYLVQEFCSGGILMPDAECEEGATPLSEETARRYTRQIMRALEYMHQCGVIHRDLKPQNILLDASKTVIKLCDFGTACIIHEGETLTVPKGTPAFMAPEILLDTTVRYSGPPADIWSLGATLYMMVVGHQPWRANDYMKLSHKVRHDELTFPKHTRIDPHLKSLLEVVLTKDPKKRPTLTHLMRHEWITREHTHPMRPASWARP